MRLLKLTVIHGGVSEETKQIQQSDAFIRLSNSPSEGELGEHGPGGWTATSCDISTLLLHSEVNNPKLSSCFHAMPPLLRINFILKETDLDI